MELLILLNNLKKLQQIMHWYPRMMRCKLCRHRLRNLLKIMEKMRKKEKRRNQLIPKLQHKRENKNQLINLRKTNSLLIMMMMKS